MRAAVFPGESFDIRELSRFLGSDCFEGAVAVIPGGETDPGDRLKGQKAVYAIGTTLWDRFRESGEFSYVSGHSLGFYAALYASGVVNREQGLSLIEHAYAAIREVSSGTEGGMSAIIGLKWFMIDGFCSRIPGVYVANINSATQIVISGTREGLAAAEREALRAGALTVRRLNIDAPLHSPLMKGVEERLRDVVERMAMGTPKIPIVNHTSPGLLTDLGQAKDVLCGQFTDKVLWRDAVEFMYDQGVREFVEMGPSDVLSKLIRWIRRDAHAVTACETLTDSDRGTRGINVQA
jgi:[acyl-carrier-protein] S-malonyltransferase